jgi:hypothetical protein
MVPLPEPHGLFRPSKLMNAFASSLHSNNQRPAEAHQQKKKEKEKETT